MSSVEQTAAQPIGAENDPLIGRKIAGKYRIIERLGGGGMGAVYRAEQDIINRIVAIKVLHTHLCEDDSAEFMKRFQREATIASRIDHPNAITMYDFGIEDGSPYIVMQYAEGRTLKALLLDEGPLSLERADDILFQICSALSVAHESGIIHRDLKPDNIMISRQSNGSERVQVLDFGIAKPLSAFGGESSVNLTRTGTFMGTPKYMAPEQALEKDIDVRCDVYSLGIILYEMITGEVPFESDSPMEILLKHVHTPPLPAREFKPELNLPEEVSNVTAKALEKDPLKRFPTTAALSEAFSTAIESAKQRAMLSESDALESSLKSEPKNSKSLFGAAVVFMLLLIAGAAVLVLNNKPDTKIASVDKPQIAILENTERPAVELTLPGTDNLNTQTENAQAEYSTEQPVVEATENPAETTPAQIPEQIIDDSESLTVAVDGSSAAQTIGLAAQLARAASVDASSGQSIDTHVEGDAVDAAENQQIAAMSAYERREEAAKLHKAGRELMEKEDYLKAGVLFKRALTYQENHLSARLSLGVCLLKLGKPEYALVNFNKALEIDKQYAPTYYNLASYYAVTNQPKEAVAKLNQAIKLYPRIKTWLKDDSDFDNIRGDEAFKAIANFGSL